VTRVRQGTPYYTAMGEELRARGYPMQSPFNWRTPLHLSLVALATDFWARVTLVALSIVSAMALWLGSPKRRLSRAACGATLFGTLLVTAAPSLVFLPETWSGVLIACSAGALAQRRISWGIAAGLAALAVRELAAPYCVASTLMAMADRDWPQVRAWLLGAVGYGVYFGWHVSGVAEVRLAGDLAQTASWLQYGGVPAVLSAMPWTSWWFLAPPQATPVLFTLVVAGICAPDAPRHARATAAAYLAFLLVVGQSFNHYWGLVAAPIWAFVAGCGVAALMSALGRLRRPCDAAPDWQV
jgi:hypothetical protein